MREIQRVSIADEVMKSIKESIEHGEYQVGDKLPTEAQFCEMFNVSRTSVREAIRVLQALGYVEIKPGKGAFVAADSIGETPWYEVKKPHFEDFMQVRLAVETFVVRLAAESAADKDIKNLEEIQTSFVEANDKKDMMAMIMLDELFHTTLVKMTKNQLLININTQLLQAFKRFRTESFTNETTYQNAIDPHQRIIDCLKVHDVSGAVNEMRKHLNITTNDMKKLHEKYRKSGG